MKMMAILGLFYPVWADFLLERPTIKRTMNVEFGFWSTNLGRFS
jgi:hypothetical protein